MRASCIVIDPGLLEGLYVDEGLSTIEIATKLGCAGATILRRLRQHGIGVRPRGPAPRSRAKGIGINWSPQIAYALGLMATDGNISGRKGQLSLVSKEPHHGATRGARRAFRRLLSWLHRPRVHRQISRREERALRVRASLNVSLVSASRRFLDWIRTSIRRLAGVSGAIHSSGGRSQRPIWALRYAKAESIRLLGWMYYAPGVPCLARERDKAVRFIAPLGYASARPVGRPRVGWLYTVPASDT